MKGVPLIHNARFALMLAEDWIDFECVEKLIPLPPLGNWSKQAGKAASGDRLQSSPSPPPLAALPD